MKKEKLLKNKLNEIYETFQDIKDLELENIINNAKYIEQKCGPKCMEIINDGNLFDKNNKKNKKK